MRIPSLRDSRSHLRVGYLGRPIPCRGFALDEKNTPHLCGLLVQTLAAANLILARIVAISPLAGIHAPLLTMRSTVRVHLLFLSVSGRSHFFPGPAPDNGVCEIADSQPAETNSEPLALQIRVAFHRRSICTCAPCGQRGIYFWLRE